MYCLSRPPQQPVRCRLRSPHFAYEETESHKSDASGGRSGSQGFGPRSFGLRSVSSHHVVLPDNSGFVDSPMKKCQLTATWIPIIDSHTQERWDLVSWQVSPVHYGLSEEGYETGTEEKKDLWVLKVCIISLDLVSKKSNVEKKPSCLSLSSAEKVSFSALSEHSVLCNNTKVASYLQDVVNSHGAVLKLVGASVKSSRLLPDSGLRRIPSPTLVSPLHLTSEENDIWHQRSPWRCVLHWHDK